MKKINLLLSAVFILTSSSLHSQNKPAETDLNINPFAKGKWRSYVASENLGFSRFSYKFNGVDQGTQTNFNLNWGTNYFVSNGLGVGIDLRADISTFKNMGKQTNTSLMAYGNVMYGNRISDDIFWYVRGSAGFGKATYKFSNPITSNKESYNQLGYMAELGFPIKLGHKSSSTITPEISYRSIRTNLDDGKETDSRFGFGLRLESYLFCRQVSCGCKQAMAHSQNMYMPGSSYLGISTKGGIRFGTIKTVYDNNFPTQEDDYTRFNLSAEYMTYVTKNFAVGAQLNYRSSVTKDKMTNYENSNRSYSIAPMFELNAPFKNALNNVFLRGGVNFGGQTAETSFGTITNKDKYTVIEPCVGLGYNFFFSEKLALTLMYEYEWGTRKYSDSDDKEKFRGSAVSLGVRRFFRK